MTVGNKPLHQVCMPNTEQGADDLKTMPAHQHLVLLAHALESMRTTKQVPKHRFRLIVGMMGEKDSRAAVLFRKRREKFVPCISGRSFQRFASLLHPGPDIATSDFTLAAKFLRQLGNEAGVRRRCPSAQLMIEMTHDEIFEPSPNQKVQQSHRIRPAGNADKIAAPLRGAGKPRNIGGIQHFRTVPDE